MLVWYTGLFEPEQEYLKWNTERDARTLLTTMLQLVQVYGKGSLTFRINVFEVRQNTNTGTPSFSTAADIPNPFSNIKLPQNVFFIIDKPGAAVISNFQASALVQARA